MRLDALIGERLGRYQIEALIGRGGMAAVYRAFDPALQRSVALKVLYPQFLADADLVERFRREAVTAARLDHPNIAPIYDVGEADGLVYLAMKLLPGPSLADLLQREGRLPAARVVSIAAEIAAALEEAHREGIVHRDVKPGNVIFDRNEHAILTDFGIAKSLEAASLTESSVVIGTPDYIAPEQIDGRLAPNGQIDARADIYALGAMLYRMLSGRRPYDGSAQAVLLQHLRDNPPAPSRLAPGLPTAVDAVIARAMAKRPEERYPAASLVVQDLQAALGEVTAAGMVFPPAALRRELHTRTTTEAPIDAMEVQGIAPRAAPTPAVSEMRRLRRARPLVALATLAALVALGAFLFRFVVRAAPADGEPRVEPGGTAVTSGAGVGVPAVWPSVQPSPTVTTMPPVTATFTAVPPTSQPVPAPAAPAPTSMGGGAIAAPPPARPATPSALPGPGLPAPTKPQPAPPATKIVPPTKPPSPPPTTTTAPRPTAATTAPRPSSTSQPAACAAPLQGGFGTLWKTSQRVQAALGCPIRGEIAGPAAEQVFETGTMYWWSGNQQIYVLTGRSSGHWSVYPNTYREGEDLTVLSPPAGFYAPVRGFGKVWRDNPAVSDALGWGEGPEAGLTGVYQRFANGTMLYAFAANGHGRQIYVLYDNRAFATYPDPE